MRAENLLPGDVDWDVSGSGHASIQGFATDMSVNVGATIQFKIDTPSTNYRIDIYRLGYYNGAGARKVATIDNANIAKLDQPGCLNDTTTGLIDCGNWGANASWTVPANAVSGVYIARPTRQDGNAAGQASHIYFVVRDDSRVADILMQTSDTTWQAYNLYGGNSLYCGSPYSNEPSAYACPARAVKVSYNRPFDTRDHDPQSFLFNAEYPMIRFLEANGYDVKYWSGVDSDRFGGNAAVGLTSLKKPKIFLSVGHDEYWSGTQRTNVENARNAGVNLAFMSGNEIYWKTRWEPSLPATVGGPVTGHRTLVSYKETLNNAKIDPGDNNTIEETDPWTGTWRDTRFSPPSDGGRPENALIGSIWTVNSGSGSIQVPASMAGFRLWRNTRVANLPPGGVASLGTGTLGYEWGEALENGVQPAGLVRMSSTTMNDVEKIIDFGSNVGRGPATHTLTLYKHQSGALVFGASTVQWSWGLDGEHDQHSQSMFSNTPDQAIQQATINLFADMGAQPASLQAGADPNLPLQTSGATTDITAPTSTITSPAPGAQVESGNRITVTGTAVDAGGGAVGAVEVSVDGGVTWNKATGTTTWTYDWVPGLVGPGNVRSRAIDDTGNIEVAGTGVSVSIVVGECPCTSLWKDSVTPANASFPDASEYELGVKFQSDINGFITGIRFYKGPANNGTHAGSLWSETGTLLATAVFTNETATGWQKVDFAQPVAITANTTYVASYHTPQGGYAVDINYFASAGRNSPPLRALPSPQTGGTGVFSPGAMAFPNNGVNHNYWVDVVFAQSLDDEIPPIISALKSTTIDSSRVSIKWTTNEASTTRIDYGTDPAIQTASLQSLPPGTQTVGAPDFVTQHGLTLTGLQPNTTYYYLVSSSDGAGNVTTVAAPSFTVPGPTLRDTAATDFAAGTTSSTYVSQTADGEVMLTPTVGAEFTGPGLPQGWVAANWASGGSAEIVDGILLVDGARVSTCANPTACAAEGIDSTPAENLFAGPRVLEFSANYSGDQFQHAGLGQTFTSTNEPWAIFSTLSGGNLFARTNTGVNGFSIDTFIGAAPLGEFHKYRIDWKADRVEYYIDGALVVTHELTIANAMRPIAASDFNPFGGIIFVDWMRMLPTTSSGVFESRVFDANAIVNWKAIQWKASTPAGTSLEISVRTGSTPTPDGSWTAWVPIAAPGPLTLTSQFVQYRAVMSTSNPFVTPELQDVIITTGNAPVAVNDSVAIARNSTYTFPASGPASLVGNDTDADTNDTLRVVSVTPAAHGVVTLNENGSVSYTPAPNYFGPDAFTYTMSDGLLTSSATVSITVHENNVPPVANPDLYHMQEDTTLFVPGRGVLINDTDVDNNPLTASLVTAPAQGSLTLNQGGSFTYIPPANFAGPISFTYRVFDGEAFSQPATVAIEIQQVNDAPYTVEDTFFALLNQPLDVASPGVLANDRDVEVEDTNPLTAQLISGPSHGTLTLNANGSFSYVPETDYLGTDSFVYASVDHFGAVSLIPKTVTLTVALKAVSASLPPGGTVDTGGAVSPGDPLRSQVTTPTPATVAIAQGVIAGTSSPTGYTFLNQQVNITVTGADGIEVTASPANPLVFVFEIDLSIAAGQTHDTFQIFRNNVLVPNCLGATSIPAANLDPCVSKRENGTRIKLTVLTTHASSWNMGVSTDAIDELKAVNDGPFPTNFETAVTRTLPGVLYNDFGGAAISAYLMAGSEIGGSVLLAPSGAFEFTPAAGFCGAASFQYRVGDGVQFSAPATVSFPVNCRPVANTDAFTVLEDSGVNTFTVLSNDTDPDGLPPFTIVAVTQGAKGTVMFSGAPGNMFVSYEPALNSFGSDSFTYTIRDSKGDSATGTVNVDVLPVNDAPAFTRGADQSTLEDAVLQTVPGWATAISAGPANESGQAVSFTTLNNNAALFSTQPSVSPAGTLTYQAAADAYGSAVVTVSLQDNGGTANFGVATSGEQTFTITVGSVNDAPSFIKGADQSMFEDTGAQSIANWATAISAGPANESSQAVDFLVSNDNNALFSQQPAVSPSGTLTFDPAPNAYGSATVSVRIHDNGGTADGGVDTSAAQTFTITVSLLNDAPTFTPGADQTVNEDAGAQSIAWATNVSAGPADEAAQALTFVIDSNSNAALFSVLPSLSGNGTLTYTPAPNANGTATVMVRLTDDGGTLNGGVNTSVAHALAITVNAVNDAPSFVKGADQSVLVNSGAQTVAAWATAISAGPANEAGQVLTFTTTNSNTALFSAQPAVAANGTLTFTPAPGMTGTATVTVTLSDNGGTTNGGVNTSASQTFTISVIQGTTATAVSSSNINALAGTSVTFTATVTPVPGTSLTGGIVTFRRGTTVIGTAVLDAANTATLTTTTLPAGTHSITAAYAGSVAYLGSTSAAISQVISPSSTIKVKFQVHALQDNTKRPRIVQTPVAGALVRVYRRWETCTATQYVSVQPKKWGVVFDGPDGPGGQPGCPAVSYGSYTAEGTTDADGYVNIIVPPTTSHPNIDYLVIGKSEAFNITTTATDDDVIYAAHLISSINAGQTKNALLHEIRQFNGKRVAGWALEEFGSYLAMVQPEEIEFTDNEVLYPVILVAEGDWDVTTSIATPSGFVPSDTSLSAAVADASTALQFTITDIGSEWTPTTVTHVVKHLGTTRVQSLAVPMLNNKATSAKIDYFTVNPGSSANVLDVLVNDNVAPPKTLTITRVVPGQGGGHVSIAADHKSVLYTPPYPSFVGTDMFQYFIQDSEGAESSVWSNVRINSKPSIVIDDISVAEGNQGSATAFFNVTLSGPSDMEISFDYATVDGTAVAGKDFSYSSGTATFAPGETRKQIAVQIIGNAAYQLSRQFTMKIWLDAANKTNAVVLDAVATGGIVEDDPKPVLSATDVSVIEGQSGPVTALVTVTLTNDTALTTSVKYTTANGSATAASGDYVTSTATLTFAPGETSKTIELTVNGDVAAEATETFSVNFSNVVNAVAPPAAKVTIIDDDSTSFVSTTVAQFEMGTVDAGAYITKAANGEISLLPALVEDFPGTTLPAGWTSTPFSASGVTTVDNKWIGMQGSSVMGGAAAGYGPGRALEFSAIYIGVAGQWGGFSGSGSASSPFTAIGTRVANAPSLVARTVFGTTVIETPIVGNFFNSAIAARIEWTDGSIVFYVNGKKVATHNVAITVPMRPTWMDSLATGGELWVQAVRMTPYAAEGNFTSQVFDAGGVVTWSSASWTATLPAGTGVTVQYRTGNTPTPDATWTSFTTVPASGGALTGSSRYLQFTVRETTSDSKVTPLMKDVTVTFRR